MASMALQQLMQGLSSGQAQQQPDQGQQLAQQASQGLSQLRSVNPQMIVEQIDQMYQLAAAMIPHTAQSIPEVAQYMAATLKGLSKAKMAAQKAQMMQSVSNGPINMSAAPDMGSNF